VHEESQRVYKWNLQCGKRILFKRFWRQKFNLRNNRLSKIPLHKRDFKTLIGPNTRCLRVRFKIPSNVPSQISGTIKRPRFSFKNEQLSLKRIKEEDAEDVIIIDLCINCRLNLFNYTTFNIFMFET